MKNVLLSHRYAAGGNDEIGLLHFVYLPDASGGGLRVVLQHLDNDGLCAQLPQPGSQYIQAGIVYFSGEKGSAGEAQLISGGEQGDTGAARHRNLADPHAGQNAQLHSSNFAPCLQKKAVFADVFALTGKILSGSSRAEEGCPLGSLIRVLLAHHAVGPLRHHSPCHNAEGTAFFNSMGRGAAGVCGIADLQIHGSFGGCIADIFASDRIAVQSGPVKGRIIHGGKDVFGEKTACALL